jgi:serine/threonine-protein kinase HipA
MKYTPVTQVYVFLEILGLKHKVGKLLLKNRQIYFEYDQEFVKTKLQISPLKMPITTGVLTCHDRVFDGLFGVFNDSLPDGWGRLLLDRQLRHHGIAAEILSPLDRLILVGERGMGALTYEPAIDDFAVIKNASLDLDKLANDSMQVLEGNSEAVFSELCMLSSTSLGARPKVQVGINADKTHIIHGENATPNKYELWMVKFAASNDIKDIGAIEYAYSLMARNAGLEMMPTFLFPAKKGFGYFGVKRFDRSKNKKIHTHTLSGILHVDHRMPSLDYEQILRATKILTNDQREVENIFKIAAFNVLAHNKDDHSKNFAFLMQDDGTWKVAPAYDLTFSSGPAGEHCTTIMGEGKPTSKHLSLLANKANIPAASCNAILEQVSHSISKWKLWAEEAGVSNESAKLISKYIC